MRGIVILTFVLVVTAALVAHADEPISVVLIGDSNINSYGVAPGLTFADLLQAKLKFASPPVRVIANGSFETTRIGNGMLTVYLKAPDTLGSATPRAVILELGANDCAYYDLTHTRDYLDQMLTKLDKAHVPVLLVGTSLYDACAQTAGVDYNQAYTRIFPELAAKHGALYYADYKTGVNGHPELLQSDGDHPNELGEAVILSNMLPVIRQLLDRAATN